MKVKQFKKLIERAYIEVLLEGKPNIYTEAEKDPKPQPEDLKGGAELPDATDMILAKFPTLKHAIIKLQTEDFKEFVSTVDWISPRPTAFRVNLKNGQNYILKWMGEGFEAQIMGKKHYINSLSDYQQALNKLSILYREGPMQGAGQDFEGEDSDGFGPSGGGGDFPGTDTTPDMGLPGEEAGPEGETPEGEESKDLGGEPVDFEEPSEEPKEK